MKKILYSAGLMLFMVCCKKNGSEQNLNSSDWTIFRGDAGLKGYSDVQLPDKLQLLWAYKSDSRTSSSPVISKNTVYWCDKRGKIIGVDIQGTKVFEYDFATAVEASPIISDSMLYIGRIDGLMSALSLSQKDTVWNFETMGQISASPNIGVFEGREAVVFGSYDNILYCLEKSSGKLISRFESDYYINGAVAVTGKYFVSGGCDAWLKIIDGESGSVTDSLLLDAYIPASAAIDGNECYVADHSGNVYVFEIEEGKIVNQRKIITATDSEGSFVSVPALSKSTVYILSDDRNLYALDRKTGLTRWKYLQKGISGESSPLVCRDKVISCSRTGIVSVLDAETGKLIFEYDAGEQITASPAASGNGFYVLTNKGTLLCFGRVHE
ncbi:MAG: PQQ-binding-like beta-propeller repeat protein [Tannerella sp.]|jgi:outer membrane protein assembly factor BamB|nr:PQQ-binding-like beta-propeller repeat protein [Tannerella sp.]